MSKRSCIISVWLGVAFAACGGGGSGPATPPSTELQVAGSYQINPTLGQNGCGNVTVLPGPAQVTHAAGASDLRLSHAGQTYSGRVERSGAFVMNPLVITFAPGSTDTVAIEGRFSTNGFDANVTVDAVHGSAPACRYVVRWQASKQGAPNVIPG